MSHLEDVVRKELVKFLVQKTILCPRTDEVLDIRTCVVLLDRDGDPSAVLSQRGYAELRVDGGEAHLKEAWGIVVDSKTVKA